MTLPPPPKRRTLLISLAALGAGSWLALGRAQPPARTIEITARRFRYEPAEVHLTAGEAVVLQLRALDFPHGFNMPDLGKRIDLMPGQVVRLELPPLKAGEIEFLCDNFCGEGHEQMHGRLIVGA